MLTQRLLEILAECGKLDANDLQKVLGPTSNVTDGSERAIVRLIRTGLAAEEDVATSLARLTGLGLAVPADYPDGPVIGTALTARFLKHALVVPLSAGTRELVLAMADPSDEFAQRAIALACGRTVQARVGRLSDIETAIERCYGSGRSALGRIVDDIVPVDDAADADDVAQLRDQASEAPVVRMVNLLIERAVQCRASDIHIEPFEDRLKVRYRIDGILQDVEAPPFHSAAAVISRAKLMSRLDIAERRLPQDGRVRVRAAGRVLDLRVSTVPTLHGESVVMRLLDREGLMTDLDGLGFDTALKADFERVLDLPHGIILVTGPTGSGKTTTLYAALHRLNTHARKIITVEDPIEYQIEGINQIQVKPGIGLDFARGLRAIVRQDPDVIMVGEMRDHETARIAVQSALTGHLVLSTLHTNDAVGAVTRLLDMGVADYLVTSTVRGVLAQRLVRVLCTTCRTAPANRAATPDPGTQSDPSFHATGCSACANTGYVGRRAILEWLPMTERLREAVRTRADSATLAQVARGDGMRTMHEDGLAKVAAGITSLQEVLRVTTDS